MGRVKTILILIVAVFIFSNLNAQGLPPGWEYTVTGDNHTISIAQTPIINGAPIEVGDYIGVFFINDQGGETCGGAIEWTGGSGTAISAFGDDNMTPGVKDGFANNEEFIFRVYSWCGEVEYTSVTAVLNSSSLSGLNWVPNGLTSLAMVHGTGSVIHAVSGIITGNGIPLEDIEVTFTNGVNSVVTDADGQYVRCVPDQWSGEIIPLSSTYTFDPVSIALSGITAPSTGNDFSVDHGDVTISGSVSQNGAALPGVTIAFSNGGGVVTTTSSGTYSISLSYGWSGAATPSMNGKVFSPVTIDYTDVTTSLTNQDYVADDITYTVSGMVHDNGTPMEDVEIQLTGLTSVFTDVTGNWSFSSAYGWTGVVTPVKYGFSFSPEQRNIQPLYGNLSGQDFEGTVQTLTMSGNVYDDDGDPIQNTKLIISGEAPVFSNAAGYYSFEVELGWTGTIQPVKVGFIFTPVIHNVVNAIVDKTDLNFTGTSQSVTVAGDISTSTGEPVGGVNVVFSNGGGNVITDANGNYSITLDYGYSGFATPNLLGYSFSPNNKVFSNLSQNKLSENFTATEQSVFVSGNILQTDGGDPIEGVTVFFNNGGGSDTTDIEGYYSIELPYGWSGTAYPDKDNYTFSPPSRPYNPVTNNLINHDYEGSTSYTPPGWGVVPTDNSHIISIPIYSHPKINGSQVSIGDFIGVFYWDEATQTEKCGGFCEWTGTNSVTAYGNDPSSAIKDGFYEGEIFRWRIYRMFNATDYEAIATYHVTNPYTFDGKYHTNALSELLSLNADVLTVEVWPESTELCAGNNLILSASPGGGSGNYTFAWSSIPAGFSSSQTQIIVSPNANTVYRCDLSTFLSSASDNATVIVVDQPVAPQSITSDRDGFCADDAGTIFLTATGGNGAILRWFSEGIEMGIGNPLVINSPEVTTTYCAQYENNCGITECVSVTITVLPLPVAPESVISSDYEVCINDSGTIELAAIGGSGDVLNWYANGEIAGTGTPLEVDSPEETTTYYAAWKNICDSSELIPVTVNVLPVAIAPDMVVSSRDQVCVNDPGTITLTAVGGSGDVVHWYVEDLEIGTGSDITIDSPEITTTYCAAFENSCGFSECTPFTITVLPLPVAPTLVTVSDSNVCINDSGTITLYSEEGSGDEMKWFANDNYIGSGTPLTLASPVIPTTYCAAWENSCGISDCISVDVTVIELPVAPETVYASVEEVCVNDPGQITLYAQGGAGENIAWYVDDVMIGTGSPLFVDSPVEETIYCAQWENECAVSECVPVVVTVLPLPEAPEEVTASQTEVCINDPGTITLTAHGGNGDVVNWYEGSCGGGAIGTGIQIIIPSPQDTTTYYALWESLCGISNCAEVTVNVVDTCQSVHQVSLNAGWSGISSWVVPDDNSTENIFAPIFDDLVIVKDLTGVYWPPYANTIPNWDTWQGYKIKVENPVNVTFIGDPAEVLAIDLDQGWSLIPVLVEDPVSAASVFEPLAGNILIVKAVASPEVYWPGTQVYSLQTLTPGKSYMLALENPAQISFANGTASKVENYTKEFVNPWNSVTRTANSHIISLVSDVISEFCSGDILGVFNAAGRCVGVVEISQNGQNSAVTVFGDDPTTDSIDGMIENEPMQFRLWQKETNTETILAAEFSENYPNKELFASNGLGAVTSFTKVTGNPENAILTVNMYPVPAKDVLFVEVMNNNDYSVKVYTISGQELMIKDGCYGKTEIETEDLSPGVYMLKIKTALGTAVKRFVVGR